MGKSLQTSAGADILTSLEGNDRRQPFDEGQRIRPPLSIQLNRPQTCSSIPINAQGRRLEETAVPAAPGARLPLRNT